MSTPLASLVLVDTSVWIDYYHPRGPTSLKQRVQKELERGTVATMGLIAVELSQGAPNASVLEHLQGDLLGLHWLELTQAIWLEAGRLGARLRQAGASLPATDIVIAATAIYYHCTLWHRDTDFTRLVRHQSSLHAVALS